MNDLEKLLASGTPNAARLLEGKPLVADQGGVQKTTEEQDDAAKSAEAAVLKDKLGREGVDARVAELKALGIDMSNRNEEVIPVGAEDRDVPNFEVCDNPSSCIALRAKLTQYGALLFEIMGDTHSKYSPLARAVLGM